MDKIEKIISENLEPLWRDVVPAWMDHWKNSEEDVREVLTFYEGVIHEIVKAAQIEVVDHIESNLADYTDTFDGGCGCEYEAMRRLKEAIENGTAI